MLEHGKVHAEGGKLVIFVQHDEPADPKQRQNWLSAPDDPFALALRIYWPDQAILDGKWEPSAIKKS